MQIFSKSINSQLKLSKYKHPKRWIRVKRNDRGKIDFDQTPGVISICSEIIEVLDIVLVLLRLPLLKIAFDRYYVHSRSFIDRNYKIQH
jgi:hypothetical protein